MIIFLKRFFSQAALGLFVAATYLFLYVPVAVLVLFSFNKGSFPSPWQGFTLEWYYALYESQRLWTTFANSCIVACAATALSLILTTLLIAYSGQRQRASLVASGLFDNSLFLFYANSVVPELVVAVGLLSLFTFLSIPLGLITLIIAHTVLGLGFSLPIVIARFKELDYRLLEASADLGATPRQTFFRITLPLLRPALMASGLLIFVLSFDDFILSYFCAGGATQTISLYILSMIKCGVSPEVNALSTILLLASSVLVGLFCYLQVKARIF